MAAHTESGSVGGFFLLKGSCHQVFAQNCWVALHNTERSQPNNVKCLEIIYVVWFSWIEYIGC